MGPEDHFDRSTAIDVSRAEIDAALHRPPRLLTEDQCKEARQMLTGFSGWTSVDPWLLDAVRAGATGGTMIPAVPLIAGVEDTDVSIDEADGDRAVVVVFSHDAFPGTRFGYRFHPGREGQDLFDLMEAVDTGALHQLMEQRPPPVEGIIWMAESRDSPHPP